MLARSLEALLEQSHARRIVVAVSGGVDSVALLSALCEMPAPVPLRAVHVNHHLHPNAALWERHCRRLCRDLEVPLSLRHARIEVRRGASLEAVARDARYRLLRAALRPGELLLTAHHLDDQLETVLLQMLRGAGIAGLAAMPSLTRWGGAWLGRPLLQVPRAALVAWASASGLHWVDDDTNVDERFDRNYLRLRVLPVLRARWPSAARTVARSAAHLGEVLGILTEVTERDLAGLRRGDALDGRALVDLPVARQRLALRAWLAERGAAPPDSAMVEQIRRLTDAVRPDAAPVLRWPGGELRRFRGWLHVVVPAATGSLIDVPSWSWERRRRLALGDGRGVLVLRRDPRGDIDLDRLPASLSIRFRHGGERVALRDGAGRRELKELLRAAAVLPWMRGRIPLVFGGESLLLVPGVCVAGVCAATGRSRRRATLAWIEAPTWRADPGAASADSV